MRFSKVSTKDYCPKMKCNKYIITTLMQKPSFNLKSPKFAIKKQLMTLKTIQSSPGQSTESRKRKNNFFKFCKKSWFRAIKTKKILFRPITSSFKIVGIFLVTSHSDILLLKMMFKDIFNFLKHLKCPLLIERGSQVLAQISKNPSKYQTFLCFLQQRLEVVFSRYPSIHTKARATEPTDLMNPASFQPFHPLYFFSHIPERQEPAIFFHTSRVSSDQRQQMSYDESVCI